MAIPKMKKIKIKKIVEETLDGGKTSLVPRFLKIIL